MTETTLDILLHVAKIGGVFFVILTLAAYLVFAERRILGWIQDRKGPNRVGPAGLFQPVADAMKFLLKEDFTPAHVNKFYYWLAPSLAMVPAITTIAVVPFGSTLFGVPMVIADINEALLKSARDSVRKIPSTGKVETCVLDVTDKKSISQCVGHAVRKFRSVDVLVNSAAMDPKFDSAHAGQHAHRGLLHDLLFLRGEASVVEL